jgi:hypothetical protein
MGSRLLSALKLAFLSSGSTAEGSLWYDNNTGLFKGASVGSKIQAFMPSIVPLARYKTGLWYPLTAVGPSPSNPTLTDGRLMVQPFWVPRKVTIDQFAISSIVTNTNISTVLRAGIWVDDGTFYPGALTADWGTIPFTGTGTGSKTWSSLATTLNPDLYWVGVVPQGSTGATGTYLGVGITPYTVLAGQSAPANGSSNQFSGRRYDGITGALTDLTAVAPSADAQAPLCFVNLSA